MLEFLGNTLERMFCRVLHGPFTEEAKQIYTLLSGRVWYVAISEAQRAFCPDLSYAGTVHNGIDVSRYPFRAEKEDFLLFLGRINREKGPELAVEIAHGTELLRGGHAVLRAHGRRPTTHGSAGRFAARRDPAGASRQPGLPEQRLRPHDGGGPAWPGGASRRRLSPPAARTSGAPAARTSASRSTARST